jgi:hypothetical protein
MTYRRVIIESPYAGSSQLPLVAFFQRWRNRKYARECVRDSLERGEAPIASHLLYTQPGILKDHRPEERQWGIDAGLAWRSVAEETVVYIDRGITDGMIYGVSKANIDGIPVIYRRIES